MFSLDEEAKLYLTNAEREKYETQATLFGIIVALDYLERAYIRDSVSAIECVTTSASRVLPIDRRYAPACTRLLSQYKTMMRLVSDSVPSIEDFMRRYKVSKLLACLVTPVHLSTSSISLRLNIAFQSESQPP